MAGCSSCFSGFQQEHVRLVKNCYPTTAAQEVANSSAVSYLCFYANAHPSKLPAILKRLEKRIQRDYSSNRPVQVKIGLEVVSGLSAECDQHFARFGRTVLNILLSLLDNSALDNDVFNAAMDTFATFSKHYDHTTLDFEEDFRKCYMSMLENCQRGCLSEQPNVSKQNRSRLSSLRALHAVVAHPSLDGSADLEEYMEMIMPALLVNIQVPIDPAREPPAGEGPQPSLTTVSKEAESCLVEAMQGVNAANFWRIMRPFYKSTEILQLLVKYPARAEYILDIAVASVNPIYRPSLVDVAVKRLLNATNKQLTTPTVPLSRAGQLTLIGMLTKTISTGGLAVGVTVLELVDSLTQLLNKSIEEQMRSRDGTVRPITGVVRQDVQELEDALIKCVGSLAVSVYYPTQVNDIVGFIVNRLRDEHPISRPAERPTAPNGLGQGEHEDLVASEVRKSLVRCLREVMETAVSGTETATFHSHTSLPLDEVDERPKWTSISVRSIAGTSTSDGASNTWSTSVRRTPLPDEYVTPLISFLESSDSELRLECGLFLYYFLNDAADQRDESGSAANVFHAKQLRHELHGAMYRIASSASSLPVDLILVYLNLLSMLHKYGSNELLEVVPWTFAAQKRAIDELETDLPRNRAVMGLVVKLYEQIAERFASGPLQKLVADSLAEMRDLNWFFSSLELARVEETAGKPWPQVEGTVGAAGRVLERSAVIEALLADSSLASKSDARAALESSYDPSGPLLPDPEPPKIEVSPPSGNGKPIAISTSVLEAIVSTEIRTPPPKPIVDVSNLKRALDGPSDVRAVSPAPSNAMSVGTASSPVAGRGHGGRDSETTSLARSNVSVARLEKKKALSAEAATLLAHLTGPYQPKASSTSSTPKAANGLTPAQISLANLARPGSPSNRDKENGKVVRLVVQDAN